MVKQYRTREGEATAVDTKTALTTLGSETAPGPLLVPQGVSKLHSVLIAAMANFAAANDCSALVRLEGSGLPKGPEVLGAGTFGTAIATGSNQAQLAREVVLDVEATPGNEILVFGEMPGEDIGQVSFGVTLIFN